jgi:hypothetical protein
MFGLPRVCLLGLALAGGAAARTQAQTVAQHRARVDTLTSRLAGLEARMDSLERLEDTLEIDGVRFVVPPGQQALAADAARRALAELERRYGPEDRRLFDGLVVRMGGVLVDADRLQQDINPVVVMVGNLRFDARGGSALDAWEGAWWAGSDYDLREAYLGMVTSPSVAATRCFEGDIARCAQILGLEPVADPWTDLFDESGRRIWIARRMGYLEWWRWPTPEAGAARFRQCVEGHVDAACLELVHMTDSLPAPVPGPNVLSGSARRSLMVVSRDVGGDGTFTRLLGDTTAPLGDRLAAAAGMPLDSLLATWHARVLAAEPEPTRVGTVAGWTSLLTVVLAGALALRSTRWRLA